MARINLAKAAGMKAEDFFSSLLLNSKLDYDFVDIWYDYIVNGHKVELKSCQLTIRHRYQQKTKRKKLDGWRIGRFDFTNEETRKKQIKENIWIALVVRHKNQFIMYGFIEAKQLSGERYLSIHKARELKPLEFKDWVNQIDKSKTTD